MSIKKILYTIACTIFFLGLGIQSVHGQQNQPGVNGSDANGDIAQIQNFPPDVYYQGIVEKILHKGDAEYIQSSDFVQEVLIKILNGDEKGLKVPGFNNVASNGSAQYELKIGDKVVLVKSYGIDGKKYYIFDLYRGSPLIIAFLIFVIFVILFGRMRGFTSLVGLLFSIGILALYVVPQIIHGRDPLTVSIIGSFIIICVSLYLAHGFNRRTTIALASSLLTLICAVLSAIMFVNFTKLLGTGNEDALYLQFGQTQTINLRGLLLAGIIIGTLGVLDDVTTGQTTAVDELKKANKDLSVRELYLRGFSVGKEHIASLVNTLALAYAGASLPIFLFFSMNKSQPLWFVFNQQDIAEEIVRTLVGSISLILAVPISTLFAAYFLGRKK